MRADAVRNIQIDATTGGPSASAMSSSTRLWLGLVILFVGLLEFLMLVQPRSDFVRIILQESGPVETAQFVLFVLLAVFSFEAAGRDRRAGFPVCWKAVGVFGILAAGEESDWGHLTRLIPSIRDGRSNLNLMNVHNTAEDFLAEQVWLQSGLVLLAACAVLVLYLFLIHPLIRSRQLRPLLGRSSGRLALGGIAFFFVSQFFDVGLFPAVTRSNPYVDFWDEGFELVAVTCFVLAIVEERRWIADHKGEAA